MNIFLLIIILVGSGWLMYLSGGMLCYLLKVSFREESVQTFAHLMVGILLFSVGYAVVLTGGKTFSILLLLVGIGMLAHTYWSRRNPETIPASRPSLGSWFSWRYALYLTAFAVGLLLVHFWVSTGGLPDPYFYTFRDDIYYAQIAGFLNETGKESYLLDWIDHTELINISPYHYQEIWLTAFLGKVSGILDLPTHHFLTFSLLHTLWMAGILAIMGIRKGEKLGWKEGLAALLVFLTGPIMLWVGEPYVTAALRLYGTTKLLLPLCALIAAYLAFIRNNHTLFVLTLFALPIMNVSFLPILLTTLPVAFVYDRWIAPGSFSPDWRWVFGFIVVYLLTWRLVASGSSEAVKLLDVGSQDILGFYGTGWPAIKGAIHAGVLTLMDIVGRSWIFLLIWSLVQGKRLLTNWRSYLKSGFFVFLLLAAIAGSSILYFIMDAVQMYMLVYSMMFCLFLSELYREVFDEQNRSYLLQGVCVLIGGVFLYQTTWGFDGNTARISRYSDNFLRDLTTVTSQLEGQGVRFLPSSYYQTVYDVNPNCNYEGYILSYLKNTSVIHTLSILQIEDRETYNNFFNSNRDRLLPGVYFVHYAGQHALDEDLSNLESIQLQFMKEQEVSFAIVPDSTLMPVPIRNLFTHSIRDPKSGEIIYYDPTYPR